MSEPSHFVPTLFGVLAIGIVGGCFVPWVLAQEGWNHLLPHYRAPNKPRGLKIGGISGQIVDVKYRRALNLWIASEGFYLAPSLLFRVAHPPLLLPWLAVDAAIEGKSLLGKHTVLKCDFGRVAVDFHLPGHRRADFEPYIGRAHKSP